jgi:hypothetical protein
LGWAHIPSTKIFKNLDNRDYGDIILMCPWQCRVHFSSWIDCESLVGHVEPFLQVMLLSAHSNLRCVVLRDLVNIDLIIYPFKT